MSKGNRADPRSSYSRVTTICPREVDDSTRQELIGLVNIDPLDNSRSLMEKMINEVKNVLGEYFAAVEVLDKEPRPANILAAIKPIREKLSELADDFNELNDMVREQLTGAGLNLSKSIDSIVQIHNAALCVEKKNAGKESRSGTHKKALRHVIAGLCKIYAEFRQDSNGELDSNKIGFISAVSDDECSKKEFVIYSLKAANISHPKDISSYLV